MNIISKYKLKILSIVCFNLISLSVYIAYINPAKGYEPSIYQSTPSIVWIFLIISILGGVTLIVHQIYTKKYESNNFWLFGLLLIIFSYATFLSLHIIRGYYMWCMTGDPASHLGVIKQISIVGHVLRSNFYPLMHIYVTELQQILGLDLIQLHKLIPLYFNLLFVVFMYLFAKSILPNKGQAILASLSSCALVHGWNLNLTPNHLSNLLFPMTLFILVKAFTANKMQWKIFLIITVLLYPPFHIVPAFALGLILISLWLPKKIFSLINKNIEKDNSNIESIDKFNITLLLTLFVWGITWISSFYVWDWTIRNINTLIAEGGFTQLFRLIERMRYAENYQYNVIEYILKIEGGALLYIILSLASIPLLWKEFRVNKEIKNLISFYGPFLMISLSIILLYLSNMRFGPLRLIFYIIVICTIFTGFIEYEIVKKIRHVNGIYLNKLALGLIVIFLVGIFLSGILKLYPSPYILSSSWQTTKTEVEGMQWFFNNRDLEIEISGISIAPGRFADLLLTPEEKRNQGILSWYLSEKMMAPYHFGYNNHSSLSELYEKDAYLLITERDKSLYLDVYPELAKDRWYPSDFELLESDWGVDKLYSTGEFYIYSIINKTSKCEND